MIRKILLFAIIAAFGIHHAHADAPAAAPKENTSHKTAKSAPAKEKKPVETIKKGVAIDQLSGPRLAAAMGHYSRARQLLIGAVNEFDSGLKIADPNILLVSDAWRRAVLDQAAALNKVLAPQPAAPTGGIKYPGDSRLLTESNR